MHKETIDVAIIGAGPYGLSVASYLRSHKVAFRIFGSPMRFWLDMPRGIALKSPETASDIYTPQPGYRFIDYCRSRKIDLAPDKPVDMALFAEYGLWAQRELVPEVEDVHVCRLEAAEAGGFLLTLVSGEQVKARRVVVAVGPSYLKKFPAELEKLSPQAMTHTFDRKDYADLAHKDVTVIGCGQSALEAAGLIQALSAQTRMIVRGNGLTFHGQLPARRSLVERMLRPDSVVGPGKLGWALQHARTLTYYLPEEKRVHMTDTRFGPFGSWWLKDQIEGKVDVQLRTHLVSACERNGKVLLTVRDDNGEREIVTDHVVAGTGYVYAVDLLPFLVPALVSRIDKIERAPRLSKRFESSVKGLYFVGPLAAYSFGPLQRFVCGAEFAAPTVARHLAKTRAR